MLFAFMPTSAQSTGRTMYVKVASTNSDAVVQSSTDFFEAVPLGTLQANQPVEMLDETYGEYVKIRCTIDGKQIEGWVKKEILQAEPLEVMPRTSEDKEVGSASFAASGRQPIEKRMRRESPEMKAALERIDRFEEFLNQQLGGDKRNPAPARMEQAMRDFQTEGGLQPGNMK
ncbi:MAG: SH3 domain-containing protein [Planctomycetota bacterium]|nr:SH3 domain-containing protein [Planctomycetota bacterium]